MWEGWRAAWFARPTMALPPDGIVRSSKHRRGFLIAQSVLEAAYPPALAAVRRLFGHMGKSFRSTLEGQ